MFVLPVVGGGRAFGGACWASAAGQQDKQHNKPAVLVEDEHEKRPDGEQRGITHLTHSKVLIGCVAYHLWVQKRMIRINLTRF